MAPSMGESATAMGAPRTCRGPDAGIGPSLPPRLFPGPAANGTEPWRSRWEFMRALDPESPRHATRSSVARGPSSQTSGTVTVTANSEGGAGPADGTQAVRGSSFEVLALNPHAA